MESSINWEEKLRGAFRYFNRFMVIMWRLGLGRWVNIWPEKIGRIMVLSHHGRRSGRLRKTPVNYAIVEGEVYCMAGFGSKSDWYRNIKSDPKVEIWLPEGWWAGIAEDVSKAPDRLAIIRHVAIASGFAGKAAGIDPYLMSDEELDKLTASYQVIHIRRTVARTGSEGPGDLAWIWPLSTFILTFLLILQPRRRR
jgi:deazaflavin-dependent oxidoreductase (nitroreductase family)